MRHHSTSSIPVLLQISRSIYQLVVRMEAILKSGSIPEMHTHLEGLEKYIWTSIEHTVDSIRHNVKNILALLIKISDEDYFRGLLTRVGSLRWSDKKKFVILTSVSKNRTPGVLHSAIPNIAGDVLNSFKDLNLTKYCYELYESFLKRSEKSEKVWIKKSPLAY